MKTRNKIFIICGVIALLLIIGVLIFRNISFKNDYVMIDKTNSNMEFEIPKFSFDLKESDNNISIKNFRSNRAVKRALNDILSSYTKITFDGKDYYYSEKENYTIVDYGINNHFIFNTIYMKYVEGNYVNFLKSKDELIKYQEMVGDFKVLTFGVSESQKNISIAFYVTPPNTISQQIQAELVIAHNKSGLEVSQGILTIENDKLVYIRTEIRKKDDKLKIPTQSTFTIIEKGVLLLDNNYLNQYEKEIVLK